MCVRVRVRVCGCGHVRGLESACPCVDEREREREGFIHPFKTFMNIFMPWKKFEMKLIFVNKPT